MTWSFRRHPSVTAPPFAMHQENPWILRGEPGRQIYRKLGVHSRTQLIAALVSLAERAQPTDTP
jgi:hypothetical protein